MRFPAFPLSVAVTVCLLAAPFGRACHADVLVSEPWMWAGNPSMAGGLDNALYVAVEDEVLQWFYVFRSTDNGASWVYLTGLTGGPAGFETSYPSLAVGRDDGGQDWVYVAYEAKLPDNSKRVEVLRFDPDNVTNADIATVQSGIWMDDRIHPQICTDSPPFIGDDSVYIVYHIVTGPDPVFAVMFSRSDDHGLHWSAPQSLATAPVETRERPHIAFGGPIGFPGDTYRVCVVYEVGVYNNGVYRNDVYARVSRFFGNSWDPPVRLTSSTDDEYEARVAASLGGRSVAVVYTRDWQNSGDLDVRYAWSTNCGVNWALDGWLAWSGSVEGSPEIAILDDHRFHCAFWNDYDVKHTWTDDLDPTMWSPAVVVNDGHTAASFFPHPTLGFLREHPEATECGVAWTDQRNNQYAVYYDGAGAGPSGILEVVHGRLPGGPLTVELGAPYPNPSKGRDTLLFPVELSRGANVHVEIFDAAGRRVARTADHDLREPGKHLVSWIVPDLAPGVYFARLVTADGPTEATARVVLD